MKRRKTGLFFTKGEERVNAISHGCGLAFGAVAGWVLLREAYASGNGRAILGVWLYLAGMWSSYLTSTLYHSLRHRNTWRPRLRQLDHAAIGWHIAGSYAPLTLVGLYGHGAWGTGLLTFVGLCAAVVTLASFRQMEVHSHLETACYLMMGLAVLVAFKILLSAVPSVVVGWIVAEGVCFVAGAAFYSVRRVRYMHSVFHLFVLGGTVCHVLAVWHLLDKM